ncbi:uncharacterized protein LOC121634518 [Melanotaenia boesemani]|uniref:uncharacterized protein LOC121634518 n=1 Tax=Melanotaenia boesemani TaxID=1250792 RepID=UPI001C03C9D3|nr:uncharacterized protein LOC121634518 [Melanotaenia boesemani]
MAHMMFQDSGQEGRSVLGMLEVQVDRDPKTGATIVRSVAPVSTPADAPKATTVFDDGRKSIHTVGGLEGQPSSDELSQILSAIDGVGMKVLLDEVTVTPNNAGMKTEETSSYPEEKFLPLTAYNVTSVNNIQSNSSGSSYMKAEVKTETCAVRVGNTDDKTMMVVRDAAEKGDNMEENPVTLLFLGYTDDASSSQEENEGMLTVERVLITEDGEEHVLGAEMSASPQSPLTQGAEPENGEESKDKTLIPVDGNEARVKDEIEKGDKGKCKACHCCSVM